jgi:hypothetical protein
MKLQTLKGTIGKVREEKYLGRMWTVVPVVALVEGVMQAMNAATPEMVPLDVYSKIPDAWNGRPVFLGHPLDPLGRPIAGNTPETLEALSLGQVFNAGIVRGKLTMEAWIDNDRALVVPGGSDLLARITEDREIEISVGAYVDTIEEVGEWAGKAYGAKWVELVPEHLALLVEGDIGACSRTAGCGVRAAKGVTMSEINALRNIPAEERDKLDDSDFAGPNRSFPISIPEDVAAASHALGRAKGDRNAIKRKIISIAYRKGDTYVAQLPEEWKKKSDQKNASLFAKLMSSARAVFAQDASETSANDLNRKLYEAIKEIEPTCDYVIDYFPVTDPSHVVYCVSNVTMVDRGYGPENYYEYENYERAFTLSDVGVVTLADARIEVKQVTKWEPVEGASPEVLAAASPKAACSCQHEQVTEEKNMKAEDIITKLAGASAEQLEAIGKVFEPVAVVETPAVETPVAETVVVETPAAEVVAAKASTFEEVLALASPEVQAQVKAAAAAVVAKKTATVATIKASGRNTFTDEQLNGKSQEELDAIVKLADVKVAVDFGGRGGAKDQTGSNEEVPAVPDLTAAIRAAAKK